VVGLDGSAGARAALTAALAEAARTGAEVDAVAGFRTVEQWIDLTAVAVPPVDELREEVRRDAERTVAEVLAQRPAGSGPAPAVRTQVRQGPPAELLVEAARGARLLVVGSRGHGTWRGLLLGSVALHCAMHAPCPVLVVRGDRDLSGTAAPAPATAGS
jgi:nucleotide-binding universal stress UspA family protein